MRLVIRRRGGALRAALRVLDWRRTEEGAGEINELPVWIGEPDPRGERSDRHVLEPAPLKALVREAMGRLARNLERDQV